MRDFSIKIALLIAFVSSGCEKPASLAPNKFADTLFIKIGDFQDRRLSDSLHQYLTSANASYRREAVLAFASIQDSTQVDRIGELLLNDSSIAVRKAAAFALGQTACWQSESLLLNATGREKDKAVLREILESYGKVAKIWLSEISTDDPLTRQGLAWSFYRFALKRGSDSLLNIRVSELLKPTYDEQTRLGAAHYFARAAKDFQHLHREIILAAEKDTSEEVRMAAALALQKIKPDSSALTAQNTLLQDIDYRVRSNTVRSLQSLPFQQSKNLLMRALNDANVNVGITASEVIKESLTKQYWNDFLPLARAAKNWRIQANLYEAALSVSVHKEVAEEIRKAYETATDRYHKAALLTALQHSTKSFGFVQEQLFNSNEFVIKSAAAAALVAMNYREDFPTSLKKDFASLYIKAMNSGDPAVIGIISGALTDPALGYKNEIEDFSFLYDAKKKLSLPKDNEALQPLEAAIAYFEGKELSVPVMNEFNHPVDWTLVKNLPRDQKAIISTTKGDITIRLLVEEAPGSVSNFVMLVMQQYFNNKFFHRVVPNFVVQAGCNRGDGWGSEDYSIRSEFSERRYKAGSVGMASAGKDTEGTQWFITHSPTPHLDGRYTIFAEVETGMDVVHLIEVGDKILNIELK